MPDLATSHLGLIPPGPLLPSASPLSEDLGEIRRLEDTGTGAVVLPSSSRSRAA
ncbi:MAG TPA: hypothetical protein VFC42_17470 [Methylomirabilota bacterium]|jgi:dihydroorotate dehydrogenase (fumarate)|nr:hypothetical protein [Methylomirabilota bacterium]